MATIAVFIALGGGAYAAVTLPKNSIGAKQIKKNAVGSVEVKNNKLTGRDIRESKLGVVPNALNALNAVNAQHAGNADLLGGSGPDAFARADRFVTARATAHWDTSNSETGQTVPVLTKGPFTITMNCAYAANTRAHVQVTTTAPKSSLTTSGLAVVFGPGSPGAATQVLVTVTVTPGPDDQATAGTPFSLYSTADGTYLAGHAMVFADDTDQGCRVVLSGISG